MKFVIITYETNCVTITIPTVGIEANTRIHVAKIRMLSYMSENARRDRITTDSKKWLNLSTWSCVAEDL